LSYKAIYEKLYVNAGQRQDKIKRL